MSYKYQIKKILGDLPGDKGKYFKRYIPHLLGVSKRTWDTWQNAKPFDRIDIGSDKLDSLAFYLGVKVSDIKGTAIDKTEHKRRLDALAEMVKRGIL